MSPAIAFDANQEQQSEEQSDKDAGFFDFSRTLNGIMKPQASEETSPISPIKPARKPEQLQKDQQKPEQETITTTVTPPKPRKKPSEEITLSKKSDDTKAEPKVAELKNQDHTDALSNKNTKLYKEIFELQEKGEIKKADALIQKLTDDRLYGYVLQQRYLHPTAYSSSFDELKTWLDQYADHTGAKNIYNLAERKRPAGNNARLNPPQSKIMIPRRVEPTMIVAKRYASSRNRSAQEAQAVRQLQSNIRNQINSGQFNTALGSLQNTQLLDSIEHDILKARIASGYLYSGNVNKAYTLASQSAARSGLHVPLASWVSGLVAWKREDYTSAARYFETVGRSNYASGWTRSAGAYWAARAHMRRGDIKSVSTWLRRASKNPRTFYGLIATRALGENFDFNWDMPTFTDENHKILSTDPRGVRAIALAKINETAKAQSELLRVNPRQSEQMHTALLAFAGYARLPGVAMRLGVKPANADEDIYYDGALYPVGPWTPKDGYQINAALVHAIVRQESRFNPKAESFSGAIGLMQLMPATAKSVADNDDPKMDDPATNLQLGQRYLAQLLKSPRVDNNLLSLLIAYNAGPGNLSKWKRRWSKVEDPLLFIELLPSAETRSYVEHVLSNYWIYRMRDNQETPTLDAVVAGAPVKFASNGSGGIQTAFLK